MSDKPHNRPAGSNGHRPVDPDAPAPGLPHLTNREAAAIAERYQRWQSHRDRVQPGYLSFEVEVVPLARVIDGERVIEQSIAMTCVTQLGPLVLHLPPELADQLAELLTDKATEARGGAVIARSRLFTPGEG